ncbi:MAG: electron transfer flavoprotein subunit beta/FixA family protein [Proteobacteria bacterium]|nr:electron transfer flavoprotein subunit beta/FixA family protein [Pseudomonadota bacterium]MBU4469851.1 electron transfer flavoprotein subunit beta/FixA family protein [Pseudomonadota bacterium]MCG2753086.1 electron transfer flavoprotein subunit beta/FixA family protein [Desulfobacteraceae bacterium]
MGLKMVVTVKQVPDTHNLSGEAMKPDGTVNRNALPAIFNPEDMNALEEALKLKETVGGTVTAITMGPSKAKDVLKECLFRGADDVILISDRLFAGADTLATSYVLAAAIKKAGEFDLILCGRQAIDGDTAQVGPQIAEKLGINQLTCVSRVMAADENKITVKRTVESGYEIVRSAYPVLITVMGGANIPRSASAKKVMMYKNVDSQVCEASYDEAYLAPDRCNTVEYIKEWNAAAIEADPDRCGLSGSPTKVKKIDSVVLAAREVKQIENSDVGISALVRELVDEHIIG